MEDIWEQDAFKALFQENGMGAWAWRDRRTTAGVLEHCFVILHYCNIEQWTKSLYVFVYVDMPF